MAQPFNIEDFMKKGQPVWEQPVPSPAPQPVAGAMTDPFGANVPQVGMTQLPQSPFGANVPQVGVTPVQAPQPAETIQPRAVTGLMDLPGQVTQSLRQYASNIFGGQVQPPMDAREQQLASQGVNPALQTAPSTSMGINPMSVGGFTQTPGQGPTVLQPSVIPDAQATQPESFVNPFTAPYPDGSVPTVPSTQTQPTTQPQAPQPQGSGLTTVGGAPLGEFLSGAAMRQQGMLREERQMAGRGETLSPDTWDQLGAQREARIGTGGGGISDRERRGVEDISQSDMAAMQLANDPQATPAQRARGQKIANQIGVDPNTGQPLQEQGGLTVDQQIRLTELGLKQDAAGYKRQQDELVAAGKVEEAYQQDEAKLRSVSGGADRVGSLVNKALGLTTDSSTTGLSGSILKHIPGTDANKLGAVLEVVKSKVALDRLAELKATGATLGQIAVAELEMLQQSYDTLQQNLQGEDLRAALINYAHHLKKTERIVAEKFIEKHGQEKYNKVMGAGGQGSGSSIPNDRNASTSGDALVDKYNK